MEKTYLKALQKIVDPPLMIPDDGFLNPIRTTPGGINYYRSGLGKDERIFPMPSAQRVDIAEAKMSQVRQNIEKSFYLDMMELPGPVANDGDVLRFTATEVQARQRDRLQIIGPLVARQEIEMLGPLIERTTQILLNSNMLPPAPDIIMEQEEFKIEYRNPVSVAMRGYELNSISQLIQFLTPIAQIDPTILQRLDTSQVVKLGADILRTPPSVVKDEAQFQQEQQQQQEQSQLLQTLQQAQISANIDQTTSAAEKNRAMAAEQLAS